MRAIAWAAFAARRNEGSVKYEGLMKYLMIGLALIAASLAACKTNPNYGNPTTVAQATATPTANPALGAPINITVAANYATPTPNPSASAAATATPIAGGLVTFTFLPRPSAPATPLSALLTATEANYTGPISLSGCASPAPVTLSVVPGNPASVSPLQYTVTQASSGSCTVSVTDGIGHTTMIQLTVP